MKFQRFRPTFTKISVIGFVVMSLGTGPNAVANRIKCWTNDDGVRECGNVVPPEYSQQGHHEINRQGVTVATSRRAKTKDELDAEARLEQEEKDRAAELARLKRKQLAKDRVLLDTFTTEEDLVLAHKGRLAAIDLRVKHTRQIVDGLKGDLSALQQRAATQERSGKPISDELGQKIAGTRQQIADRTSFVDARHQEKSELDDQFQLDLARYRELKGTAK